MYQNNYTFETQILLIVLTETTIVCFEKSDSSDAKPLSSVIGSIFQVPGRGFEDGPGLAPESISADESRGSRTVRSISRAYMLSKVPVKQA